MRKYVGFLCFCLVMLTGCSKHHTANDIVIDFKESSLYCEEERKEAIAPIEEYFEEFQDCTLNSIRYAGDDVTKERASYYKKDPLIVFLIDFYVGNNASASLNPNSEYIDWQVTLVKDENKNWVADPNMCGYG